MEVFAEGFTINSNLKIGQEIQTNPLSVFIIWEIEIFFFTQGRNYAPFPAMFHCFWPGWMCLLLSYTYVT